MLNVKTLSQPLIFSEKTVSKQAAHTKEPWRVSPATDTVLAGNKNDPTHICDCNADIMSPDTYEEMNANAKRIVDCVNACVGLNPAAIPEAVKALEAALYIRHLEEANKHYAAIIQEAENRKRGYNESAVKAKKQTAENRKNIDIYYRQINSALAALKEGN